MKKRPCAEPSCVNKINWTTDQPRGVVFVEVADDYPDDKPVFCSFECAAYAGYFDLRKGWIKEKDET